MRFTCWEEEHGGLMGLGEAGEESIMPESPDLRRGDDEEAGSFTGCQPAQARVEGAQQSGDDVDVVRGGGGGDADGGHDGFMVSPFWSAMQW